MSLLWPDQVTIGLFPGHCWLQRGTALTTHACDAVDAVQMLHELETLFSRQDKPLRKGTRVQVLLSDSLSAVMPLPWQELLSSPDELRGYAAAAFEQRGMALDDSWVVETGFRHFRATGIAYALQRKTITGLEALMKARQLSLVSVLPISAAAYWRLNARTNTKRVLLLRELRRVTAMVLQGGHLLELDVQPLAGSPAQSVTRLFQRLAVTHGAIHHFDEWHATTGKEELLAPAAAICFPGAAARRLPLLAWK